MKNVTHTYDNGFKPKKVIIKDNYKYYPTSYLYKTEPRQGVISSLANPAFNIVFSSL